MLQLQLKKKKPKKSEKAVKLALKAAKAAIKPITKSKLIKIPRIIAVPKTGGVLPFLIPLFAGLSAVGSIAGGSAAILNAINTTKNARKQLAESERHNQTMESIAIGNTKTGHGVYLKPYKTGLGLYLQHNSKNY